MLNLLDIASVIGRQREMELRWRKTGEKPKKSRRKTVKEILITKIKYKQLIINYLREAYSTNILKESFFLQYKIDFIILTFEGIKLIQNR